MLTTGMAPDIGAYNFKSSPDSSVDDSFMPDYLDLHSDDFLQTLSSDLDIPLLLNSHEDELGLLSSFLDRSPDEILSAGTPPGALLSNGNLHFDVNQWSPSSLKAEVKSELLSSGSPTPSQTSTGSHASDVKEELIIDTPPVSPPNDSFTPRFKAKVCSRKTAASPYVVPRSRKLYAEAPSPTKRPKILKPSSIMPKTTASSDSTPSVVVIEAIPTSMPQITIANNLPTYIPMPMSVGVPVNNVDPKVLKRQQRMIKNRESANLSRKKKKEYLTSLEKQVQDLTSENKILRIENAQLKERLAKACGNKISLFPVGLPSKTVAKTMVLCVFLMTMGFNLEYLRSPLYNRETFAKPSVSKISNHHSRSLLWTAENEGISTTNTSEGGAQSLPMCPMYVNQSENVRLAEELHRWIGKPFNTSEEFYKENPITERPTKIKKSLRSRSKAAKQNSLDAPILSSVYRLGKRARRVELISDNELQVYTPNIDHIYSEFFEAINRRDDTFYVVSFSPDHMLLPALHYNKTTRPKMSLIMPFMLPNGSAHSQSTAMPLMQIDCEVLDTRLIHVKYGAIPEHLRSTQGNHTTETSGRNVSPPSDSKSRNVTGESYKPYFMQKRKAKPLLFKSEFDDRR